MNTCDARSFASGGSVCQSIIPVGKLRYHGDRFFNLYPRITKLINILFETELIWI